MSAAFRRYQRVLSYAVPQSPALAMSAGLSIAIAMLTALQPWPLKILFDFALGGNALPEPALSFLAARGVDLSPAALIVFAALASVAIFAVGAWLDARLTMTSSRAGQRMVYALAGDIYLRLQWLSLLFHARRPVGDSLSRVTGDAWCVYTVTDSLLVVPAKQMVVVVSIGALAWQLDRELALLMLIAIPVLAASASTFGTKLKSAERLKRESMAQLTAFVHQVLGSIPIVQAFGAAPRNRHLFDALAERNVVANRTGAMVSSAFDVVNGIATTIAIVIVVYAGGRQVLAGRMTVGSLLVFVAYVRSLDGACRALLKTYGALRAAEASIDRVVEVLDAEEMVHDAPDARPLPARRAIDSGHLVLEAITFGYEAGQPVLIDLSLDVRAGETIALVGASGAGKTTIASLIPRFFDPWQGRILVDGIDIRALTLASLRNEIALVLQDSFILPVTVAENIAYGRQTATRAEIMAAAVAANAHDFIRRLPEGYDSILGEQGGDLSGGQRQRIAIARALLKNPRIVVLDEPTSALDAETERQVMMAISNLLEGRTTLIIAHRMATIRFADRIAVIDGGRVAEIGTHAELIAAQGRYARLYAMSQAGTAAVAGGAR